MTAKTRVRKPHTTPTTLVIDQRNWPTVYSTECNAYGCHWVSKTFETLDTPTDHAQSHVRVFHPDTPAPRYQTARA